jgi:hypothetical protein
MRPLFVLQEMTSESGGELLQRRKAEGERVEEGKDSDSEAENETTNLKLDTELVTVALG